MSFFNPRTEIGIEKDLKSLCHDGFKQSRMFTRLVGKDWIPACAGMTVLCKSRELFFVIPAQAGIQEMLLSLCSWFLKRRLHLKPVFFILNNANDSQEYYPLFEHLNRL